MIALLGLDDFVFSESEIMTKCIQIERTLYGDKKEYLNNVRERILILKDKGNPNLKVSIVVGTISIEEFCTAAAKDLADDETKKKIQDGLDWTMKA
jgi:hypothetical protein